MQYIKAIVVRLLILSTLLSSIEFFALAYADFTHIAAGEYHTCGIKSDGKAYCWGENYYGQLGDGSKTRRYVPTPVLMPRDTTFFSLAAGNSHTCGLTPKGTIYCWGANSTGTLGAGAKDRTDTSFGTSIPVAAQVPENVAFRSIAAGNGYTCALTIEDKAFCWGFGGRCGLGNGSTNECHTPTPVFMPKGVTFQSLAVGHSHTCALTVEGMPFCWGYNDHGQLGDGKKGYSQFQYTPKAVDISPNLMFRSIALGTFHSCGLTPTGKVYCWGGGWWHQLGNGDSSCYTTPVPVHMSENITFRSIASGHYHSCGLTAGGTAFCWGRSFGGQLGSDSFGSVPSLVRMPPGIEFQSLTLGRDHSCGLTRKGSVCCWGDNSFGQLGELTCKDSF